MTTPVPVTLNSQTIAELSEWLTARTLMKSEVNPEHSKHFDTFPPRQVCVPDGHTASYLGNVWPKHFGQGERAGAWITELPGISEEYFEILDVLEAAIDAENSFTMLEWGAGFGRWTGLGIAAARTMGIQAFNLGCVEAHPLHIRYIIEHFQLLKIPGNQAKIFPCALAGERGTNIFIIAMPESTEIEGDWFGQALNSFSDLTPSGEIYEGAAVLANDRGWKGIEVSVETGSAILKHFGFVDLIDMDLQGTEADTVDECIGQLNNQVRRLHIGTHGPEIEERLRQTLSANGWIKLRDLAVAATTETAFGPVSCVDGVQSWFNPRFPPRGWIGSS